MICINILIIITDNSRHNYTIWSLFLLYIGLVQPCWKRHKILAKSWRYNHDDVTVRISNCMHACVHKTSPQILTLFLHFNYNTSIISIISHDNNIHSLAVAFNALAGVMFSGYGIIHQKKWMKEFLIVQKWIWYQHNG